MIRKAAGTTLNKIELFIYSILLGASVFVGVAQGAEEENGDWTSLQIVNVNEVPVDASPRFGAESKTFFRSKKGSFVYVPWQPTWDTEMRTGGMGSHYHLWHEWAYVLNGDYIIEEPVSPYQRNGALYRYVQGTWLDRPAYTLHGGGWATGGIRAQNPATLIIFEEGDGSVVSVGPDGAHYLPDFPDQKPDPYQPNWQDVEQFARPWIVHSGSDLEWEKDTSVPGRLIKWLSDDIQGGFRAQLIKIPPDWTPPEQARKSYFERANRMRYVLWGDMLVWQFARPSAEGRPVKVGQDYYIHQWPRSIWGYGSGPVTENGAVWLEVTYAKGLEVGGGPIEEPVVVD